MYTGRSGFQDVVTCTKCCTCWFETRHAADVVSTISMFPKIVASELWVTFGVGKYFRYLAIHEIVNGLGTSKSSGLLFTGCDQVYSFANKGKKTAWDMWTCFEDISPVFEILSRAKSLEAVSHFMHQIKRIIILMYYKTNVCTQINETRKNLSTRKGRTIDNISHTKTALLQHTKSNMYIYQASLIITSLSS